MHLTKKQQREMFKDLCNKGMTVVIDCEFDDLMERREQQSMSQQLAYVHNTNKKQVQPCKILVSGIKPDSLMSQNLEKACCENWAVEFTPETYLKKLETSFKKEDMVYLTADSPNIIETLDVKKAYIIGGIVDRNRHINLTFNKAKE